MADLIVPTSNDAATPLVKQLVSSGQELLNALATPTFYLELTAIGAALMLAVLTSALLQRRAKLYMQNHPPKRIDAEFITKPLQLLAPVLALLFLSIAKPFVERFAEDGGSWVIALSKLCVSYIAAKCVVLILRSSAIGYFIAAIIMTIAVLDVSGFMKSTTVYLSSMSFELGSFKISVLNLIHGVVILVIVFWIAGLLSRTLESYLRKASSLSYGARELLVKFFKMFFYFTAFLITLSAVGVDLTAFAVFGGALGVGIGLGLQKITANFVSGITLLVERSIKIGDLIEVGNLSGTVRQLNIRYTLVETADGRELLIPNEELITTRVTNWTHSHNKGRSEIHVNISYNSDIKLAQQLMLEAVQAHRLPLKDPAPWCYLVKFNDNNAELMLTFWVPDVTSGKLAVQSEIMFTVLEKFKAAGIAMTPPSDMNIKLTKETLEILKEQHAAEPKAV